MSNDARSSPRPTGAPPSLWWARALARAPYVARPSLERDLEVDVAIVGGGLTGVSTAYRLARRFPDRSIALLEGALLGSGASGRNGGLLLNGVNGVGADDVALAARIYDVTARAIDDVARLVEEERLVVPMRRDGVLDVVTDARRAEVVAQEVERLRAAGLPLRFLTPAELAPRLRLQGVAGAVLDPRAGGIDALALVHGLRPVIESLGVSVFERTRVTRVREGSTIVLETPGGTVRAGALVLATNAYTRALGYFRSGIVPLHSHLVATERVAPARWAELGWGAVAGFSDDRDRLAYGCLTPEGELVFGGGSNAAYGYGFGGATEHDGEQAIDAVRGTLHAYLPAAQPLGIAHRWSGSIALTLSRVCTMGVLGEAKNVYYALGYSGHGITLATLAGRVLTDLYAGDASAWRDLPFFERRLEYVPPEPFRWIGYQLFTRLTGRAPKRVARG